VEPDLLSRSTSLDALWRLWLNPLIVVDTDPPGLKNQFDLATRRLRINLPKSLVRWSDDRRDENLSGVLYRDDASVLLELLLTTASPQQIVAQLRSVLALASVNA
jgi:hypothetical protein